MTTGLTGAVSWRVLDDGTVDIHRLVVAPRAFRRGIATALLDALDALVSRAARPRLDRPANGPAGALPAAAASRSSASARSIPGLWITELERRAGPSART